MCMAQTKHKAGKCVICVKHESRQASQSNTPTQQATIDLGNVDAKSNKMEVIKAVMVQYGLGLGEAKALVDDAFKKSSGSGFVNISSPQQVSSQDNFAASGNFSSESVIMEIEDVFSITGRGTIATGKLISGVSVGDSVRVLCANGSVFETKIKAIEMFRKSERTANPGDNAGLLLDKLRRNDISRGDKLAR